LTLLSARILGARVYRRFVAAALVNSGDYKNL
jgi:hypothetical protein